MNIPLLLISISLLHPTIHHCCYLNLSIPRFITSPQGVWKITSGSLLPREEPAAGAPLLFDGLLVLPVERANRTLLAGGWVGTDLQNPGIQYTLHTRTFPVINLGLDGKIIYTNLYT